MAMRTSTIRIAFLALVATLGASAPSARTLDGTVKLGGTFVDEEGDLSTVQETYNVYDGFTVAQLSLRGNLAPRRYFSLDVRDPNLDSRRGRLVYRVPGTFRLSAAYDQHRQVFTPDRSVASSRKDWSLGAQYSPARWLGLSGDFGHLARDGDRLSYPAGTIGALGIRYDNRLMTGRLSADFRQGRRGGAITYRVSDFADALQPDADRVGHVVSARLHSPTPFYDRWTHLVRGAYGIQRLSTGDLDHKLADLQYTSIVEPVEAWQFRYAFEGRRVDDQATGLKTDRFTNDVDATWFQDWGQLHAGYGYETNDDDHTLTDAHRWRGGTILRYRTWVKAKADYSGRARNDQEDLTLLKDVETFQLRTSLEVRPHDQIVVGGGYAERDREFPDVDVESNGRTSTAFLRYTLPRWGALSADYSHSRDRYTDRVGRFATLSHIVTGRAEFDRIKDLKLAGGVTYMDIGRDLDIEKSMVSLEAAYTLQRDYHVEVQYNVYNYDDYVLLSRYYTANVLRINVGYDFNLQ
jgi:hypothetical protein